MSSQLELLTALATARGDAFSLLPDNSMGQISPEDLRNALLAYDQVIEDLIMSVAHLI
jgi:hypothetical protein